MPIEAEHLTVHRLGRPVLHDVSLRIAEGEVVSVIGPNGAGKSTLMAALLGLLPRVSGEVRLDDRPIEQLPRRRIARRIAYVPQIHDSFMGFTVREVIEGGRYAHLDPLDPLADDDLQAVTSAAASAGVGHLLDRHVDQLSGGERQKVWIAAALAQDAPVLFLDEPTNALDPTHQVELIRIMRAFVENGTDDASRPDRMIGIAGAGAIGAATETIGAVIGAATVRERRDPTGSSSHASAVAVRNSLLVISHDLNLPLALGGRVLALRDGAVAFDEPVQALFDEHRLEALFGTRFVIHRGPAGEASIHVRV